MRVLRSEMGGKISKKLCNFPQDNAQFLTAFNVFSCFCFREGRRLIVRSYIRDIAKSYLFCSDFMRIFFVFYMFLKLLL